ncbi:winged helix DNA-binding domain-containing protein [Pseudochryseolinea flava]|uniref:Winged helix DNA-binding domain-containing protein n=1 Tax=Pseudochryseolinea flava TaxID=2059302 RepID=A0A364Y2H2_9BACT|nr:winged helix DNA-binding domain-containing protein [Pseudochryseolinea flava]RAW00956.1 winged helix DNA-binding domain-containing protein [Pseudochryseolinea flava]
MTDIEILQHRLANQLLIYSKMKKPEDVVDWMGAMQAQEYAMAKWAIGLRMKGGSTDDIVEDAFQKGKIIRTHVMRPTWHFVSPENLRALLSLTAPRVHGLNAYYYKQTELDAKVFKKCHQILEQSLRDGEHLTREQLKDNLADAGIKADGLRLAYIFMHAELEQLICSGPRDGKQFTYSLIDEWVPAAPQQKREEILAWFTEKYFSTRGPATAHDFAYWSGLTLKEVKEGIDMLPKKFQAAKFDDGKQYYFVPAKKLKDDLLQTFLMPDYDEYGMSYKERRILLDFDGYRATGYEKWLVIDGKIRGSWKKETKGKKSSLTTQFFGKVSASQKKEVSQAVERYETFYKGA